MARELIANIIQDETQHLDLFYDDNEKRHFPFTLKFKGFRKHAIELNISVPEYDKLIEALLKIRITRIEKEFEV